MAADRKRVLIIGGGASGVLLAAHLLRRPDPDLRVTLVERRDALGAGIAYGTAHPAHLLNVRAANMSAFPDQPDHFCRWLLSSAHAQEGLADPRCFAPRRVYRDYVQSLLDPHLGSGDRPSRLVVIQGEAQRLVETASGVEATLGDGSSLLAHVAVLATGNEGPPLPPAAWRRDGWTQADQPIDPAARVAIVGSGLTMVDQALSLLHGGHRGPITVLSRHGLTPHAHTNAAALPLDAADLPLGTRLSYLMRKLRQLVSWAEHEGKDWRCVIDGLRPHTAALWRSLPPEAKLRFLRHARAFWDVHRHRIAPGAAQQLLAARATGQMQVRAGAVVRYQEQRDGVDVLYRPRGQSVAEAIRFDVVVECRGRSTNMAGTANPVLAGLLNAGSARPDATQLGLDVTEDCALIDQNGRPSTRIYAIGPLTSGIFWESTAIPDIRTQAARLAGTTGSGIVS